MLTNCGVPSFVDLSTVIVVHHSVKHHSLNDVYIFIIPPMYVLLMLKPNIQNIIAGLFNGQIFALALSVARVEIGCAGARASTMNYQTEQSRR